MTDERHAFVVEGTAMQDDRIVISTHDDPDGAQASGEWVASTHVVNVKQ